jgi:hypothetical protein
MNKISTKWPLLAAVLLVFSVSTAYAGGAVVITEPGTGSTVSNPVKVCMAVDEVEVQPAKKGVTPGKGHHHLLI